MMTNKTVHPSAAKRLALLLAFIVLTLIVSACSSSGSGSANEPGAPSPSASPAATDGAAGAGGAPAEELIPITQVTNWYAQAEHGGNYAALAKDFYKEAGLDMTITPGVNVSGTQLLASGKAQFAMSSSDEVLMARENGIPLVAIIGTFQKSPQALTFHKGEDIKGIEDLNGRDVYVSSGITYWEYFKKAYDLADARELKYNYELSSFMANKSSVVQSYITSEPYTLSQEGYETESMLIGDFGFEPYANVIVTTEDYISEHPDIVQAFVDATIKGWLYYKDNYEEINPFIQQSNPDVPLDAFAYSAKALQPLVFEGDAATSGVGHMTMERWDNMNATLVDLAVMKASQDVSKAFTNEFVDAANAKLK
ncbi:ABC transporter substrate-binding protein [Paenibacillus arenilitoris]|uniref:ABC transporter substrate-binding protein n=1 Tax=Paenibacillus arenilitoris TaxID=2772299 RepID=A0A927CJL3_9BACL|nr:ABC transporter substrate-binding protein [Paenibacillus arenilitoris]MBD2868665.1 ABC transporter substrate-binding protein [Paenibacillus arenilitoris]